MVTRGEKIRSSGNLRKNRPLIETIFQSTSRHGNEGGGNNSRGEGSGLDKAYRKIPKNMTHTTSQKKGLGGEEIKSSY